jgi:hypothetical protein
MPKLHLADFRPEILAPRPNCAQRTSTYNLDPPDFPHRTEG